MKQELCLKNLSNLDFGKIDVALQKQLERCTEDCLDRPGDDRPRTVLLRIDLTPEKTATNDPDHVNMEMQITSKLPTHRSKLFQLKPQKRGSGTVLLFDDESPDDFEQGSFNDLQQKGDAD